MKKRIRTLSKSETSRLSLMAGTAMPRAAGLESDAGVGNAPGLAIGPGPRFDELLALIERAADVPLDLPREVAKRRGK